MEWTQWWVPHSHWFWLMPFIFMILVVFFAILMGRRAGGWRFGCGCFGRERFGCWNPGQHEQMKRYIDSSRQQPGPGDE